MIPKITLRNNVFLSVAPPAPPGTPTQLGTRHRTDSSSERFLAELRLVSAFSVDFTRAVLLNMTRVGVIKYMDLVRSPINPIRWLSWIYIDIILCYTKRRICILRALEGEMRWECEGGSPWFPAWLPIRQGEGARGSGSPIRQSERWGGQRE